MNEIRINKEEEKEIVKVQFKTPFLWMFLIIIFVITLLVLTIITIYDIYFLLFSIWFFLPIGLLILSLVFYIKGLKKSFCVVTSKRIYGVIDFFISQKRFSYRLDEISDVEVTSIIGIHGLCLYFDQGHGAIGTNLKIEKFTISNIYNVGEVYEKLSELLTSVKNDKDVMVDIEMNKVQIEQKKADAFENIAYGISSKLINDQNKNDYINELKQLKELLDAGIINEEEFENRKRNILAGK